ncbi:MAG: hypothetical protein Q8N96_07675 [Methylovulum sp.]|nr:hypothetical protein [Methylovulum sp.]
MNNELSTTNANTMPANLTDRMAALRHKAASTPELWQPEPGEQLLGVLIGHQKAVGIYGENFQILVQEESGAVKAAWLTDWIRDNLKVQGAEAGDLIALTFLGKKQSPQGRFYNGYSLIIDKLNGRQGAPC